ncbi:MAG: hypothetical protein EG828_14200, partial [Deltaproteobacteria bacterium]|nr:hypothetical protein [Deltaproteobacteria bacterium]
MSLVPKDVIILPEFSGVLPDRWVAMNVFSRTCLGVSGRVLDLMGRIESLNEEDLRREYLDERFCVWEIERFSNADGLMADPTRYIRNAAEWKDPLDLDCNALVAVLKKHYLVIDDDKSYRDRFQLMKSLLDKDHFGNFHQQVGQYFLLKERKSPSQFWLSQKFNPDLVSVRSDNLYGAVQASYLEAYFSQRISPSHSVLDVGCGTGIY